MSVGSEDSSLSDYCLVFEGEMLSKHLFHVCVDSVMQCNACGISVDRPFKGAHLPGNAPIAHYKLSKLTGLKGTAVCILEHIYMDGYTEML